MKTFALSMLASAIALTSTVSAKPMKGSHLAKRQDGSPGTCQNNGVWYGWAAGSPGQQSAGQSCSGGLLMTANLQSPISSVVSTTTSTWNQSAMKMMPIPTTTTTQMNQVYICTSCGGGGATNPPQVQQASLTSSTNFEQVTGAEGVDFRKLMGKNKRRH
ncbi:MAG: hypothetical protein Q9227_004707 [Pyrenula ochraceoflavens]